MVVGEIKSIILLTDEERAAKLDSLLEDRFTERGTLQLPQTSDYNRLTTDNGLKTVAYEMCRHLGVKPNRLRVVFSTDSTNQNVSFANNTITIDQTYRNHPYITGALLALGVIEYFIERYDKHSPDSALVEYATIHTGLGLWILNALTPRLSIRESLYHVLNGSWHNREGMQLESYKPDQYAHNLAAYAHDNRIAPEIYIKNVTARSRYLMPSFAIKQSSLSLPEPDAIQHHRKLANILWVKIILIGLIIAIALTASLYLWSQQKPIDSARQADDLQALQIIKHSFDACEKKASTQQSSYDPNDLFMTRQVDATKSRCESLRNEYNYALDQYQTLYP